MNTEIDFQRLRDEWALKSPLPTENQLDMERRLDRGLNPHNDSYKPEIRSDAQITSDRAYTFADDVLAAQYGREYTKWLADHGFHRDRREVWKKG